VTIGAGFAVPPYQADEHISLVLYSVYYKSNRSETGTGEAGSE
jgi:hypothetical protein